MNRIVITASWLLSFTSLTGCSFDLFHDTSWLTACDIDPSTPGCEPEGGTDAGSDAPGEADVGVGTDGASDGDAIPGN